MIMTDLPTDMSPASLGHLRRWAALPFCSTLDETIAPFDNGGESHSSVTTAAIENGALSLPIEKAVASSLAEATIVPRQTETLLVEETTRTVRRAMRRLIGFADTKEAQEQLRLCALNGCC